MARRAKRRDPSSTVNSTVRLDERSLGTVGERKTIPNLISELPFDILKMIYHLVLKEEHGVLLLRFKDHTLSTTYTLGPGVPDVQWYDTSDADMGRILEDEERRYGEPRTGVNLNEVQHEVYNFRNVGFYMVSRAIYNTAICYFFSMNLFRYLDFDDLKNFLQDVRYVHMIDKIQIVWKVGYKGGIKAITKGIRALQNRATGLKKLHLIIGNEVSEAMLNQEAWRLICIMARQKK